ncbi:hypothetical protein J4Q44_G00223130 [Coregonus suidteri]|uniref:Secreted protein n=1 Tax=Coregonus suidteri TaxID=861788 RepID=A0AAN8LIB5_9TELE
MTTLPIGLLLGASVCCIVFLGRAEAQPFEEQCLDNFRKGQRRFRSRDTDDSVKGGRCDFPSLHGRMRASRTVYAPAAKIPSVMSLSL